jgi:predicted nucleic acid-binding protein
MATTKLSSREFNPSDRDALIAATALVHGLTVATRNVSDFERTGVGVLNPWEASAMSRC